MKKQLILLMAVLGLFLLWGGTLYAQCLPDPDDVGIRDSMWIEQQNGRIPQGTTVVRHVWAKFDEQMSGIAIPLKYKTTQTDIFLDSLKIIDHGGPSFAEDTIINRTAGTINYFALGPTGGTIPPATDTFMIIYFRTGTTTWDPTIMTPIETTTIGGQGLSFVDTAVHDIQPCYFPPGNLDVKDDLPRGVTGIPTTFSLSQNFPNPFNATTVISFALPKSSYVRLEIYNILGQKVKDLVNEKAAAGYKRVVWDGTDNSGNTVSSGVYFYKLDTEEFNEVMKMTVLK